MNDTIKILLPATDETGNIPMFALVTFVYASGVLLP
jgi:hypothetical protein